MNTDCFDRYLVANLDAQHILLPYQFTTVLCNGVFSVLVKRELSLKTHLPTAPVIRYSTAKEKRTKNAPKQHHFLCAKSLFQQQEAAYTANDSLT